MQFNLKPDTNKLPCRVYLETSECKRTAAGPVEGLFAGYYDIVDIKFYLLHISYNYHTPVLHAASYLPTEM